MRCALRYLLFALLLFPFVGSAGWLGPRAKLALKGAPDSERATWIVRFEGDPEALTQSGAKILSRIGRVYAIEAPSAALPSLVSLDKMLDIEAPRRYQTTLDLASGDSKAAVTRDRYGLDGQGVIIAVIDTGLDIRHQDFRNEDGSTRVLFFLDLSTPPEESGVPPVIDPDGNLIDGHGGTVYDRSLLNQVLNNETLPFPKDFVGHGTHVAGIAASNGRATASGLPSGRYAGVAPNADLIIVDADSEPGSFTDAELLSALEFVSERAQALGKPVVINISIGGQSGPHDGTGPVEEAISTLSGTNKPGVAVILSAGNDGSRDLHAAGQLQTELSFDLLVPPHLFQEGEGNASLELYSDNAQGLSLLVVSPLGESFGPLSPGEEPLIREGTSGRVSISFGAPEGATTSAFLNIAETPLVGVQNGLWKILVSGEASRVDLWLTGTDLGATRLQSLLEPDGRLSSLACAKGAISVASYTTREGWRRPDGGETHTGLSIQAISAFSSFGPTRLKELRPDIAAPGEFVLSSMSNDAPSTSLDSVFFGVPADLRIGDDGLHGALRGTSMSAPHVAGLVALLFSIDPTLDVEEIRKILWLTARADAETTLTLPNTRWGFGKLDIFAASLALLNNDPRGLSLERSTIGASSDLIAPDGSEAAIIYIIPRDDLGLPLGTGQSVQVGMTLRDSSTQEVIEVRALSVSDSGDGVYQALLTGEFAKNFGDAPLQAELRASVGGRLLLGAPVVSFAFSRREVGRRPELSGGACSVAPSGSLWMFLLCVVPLLLFRRRPRPH